MLLNSFMREKERKRWSAVKGERDGWIQKEIIGLDANTGPVNKGFSDCDSTCPAVPNYPWSKTSQVSLRHPFMHARFMGFLINKFAIKKFVHQ